MYGFTIPTKGLALLAKLQAGSKLEITRVMVGDGKVPAETNPKDLTDLVSPVVQATSTKPTTVGTTTSFVIEYRNDLNHGLGRDIMINEYGVFARDPEEGEILLYYGNLDKYPEPVKAYNPGEPVTTRRYPVSITTVEGVDIVMGYQPSAYMTPDDMDEYLRTHAMPEIMQQVQGAVDAHNAAEDAHQGMRNTMKALEGRMGRMEDMILNDITKNPWSVTFEDLNDLEVKGVWNKALARIEF